MVTLPWASILSGGHLRSERLRSGADHNGFVFHLVIERLVFQNQLKYFVNRSFIYRDRNRFGRCQDPVIVHEIVAGLLFNFKNTFSRETSRTCRVTLWEKLLALTLKVATSRKKAVSFAMISIWRGKNRLFSRTGAQQRALDCITLYG